MKTLTYLSFIIAFIGPTNAFGQQDAGSVQPALSFNYADSAPVDSANQRDLLDLIHGILDSKQSTYATNKKKRKSFLSVVPYAGYTLSTGFTADISGNIGFYSSKSHQENLSFVAVDLGYDSKSQKILLSRSEIWTPHNDYKIVSDLRFERFPTDTYGLGTFTSFDNDNEIDYNYLRIYETLLRKIGGNFYGGIGYNLDYHYNITASGNPDKTVSDFQKYGQTSSSRSSGLTLNFLFDNRKNALNPLGGTYASIILRENSTNLGSDAAWQSLQLDVRKYIRLSAQSNNVLALWGMASFTNGNVPYLDLPSTGGDMYNNSGRGYALGRFRGRDMLYIEGEYRFGITKNGLLGAVIFANGESFTEFNSNTFQKIAPAGGTGIRIKLNKHSNTNICIDYGVGVGGSRGFFVNLGEVF